MGDTVRAPDLNRPGMTWFNCAAPLRLADLRGRLVLLDFWTYCCINCQHVLPTLRLVEETFPDEVVVIGVHSPKFPGEHDPETVRAAIEREDIRHPVVHDPYMILWDAYTVKAWPTLVLIGPQGHVIGQLSGEPDPSALLDALAGLISREKIQPASPAPVTLLESSPPPFTDGPLRFPGKIRPLPPAAGPEQVSGARWIIADSGHHQIVLVDDDGQILARYGQGEPGFRDGPARQARFTRPQGVCADGWALWVADTGNHALRRIDRRTGTVSTVAGLGQRGPVLRRPRPASECLLASPWDVDWLDGRLIFANAGTHQLGVWDPEDDIITVLAGHGGEDIIDGPALQALLAQPSGLVPDGAGGVMFVDAETSSLRQYSPQPSAHIRSLTGQGLFAFGHLNGPAAKALLQHPLGLCRAGDSWLIADSYNNVIRRYDPATAMLSDVHLGQCLDSLCAPLAQPAGLWAASADGSDLLIVDSNHHRIVRVDVHAGAYRTWLGSPPVSGDLLGE